MRRCVQRSAAWVLAWAPIALLVAAPSAAVPQIYQFVSGQAHITANVVGQTTLLVDTVVALDGTFFQFDPSPVGVPSFEISIAPTGPIPMSASYGGYDTFVIESALLVPGTGYGSTGIALGGGAYSVSMGPLDVNAVYSATDSTNTNPPANNVPISFTNPTLNASVDTDLILFELIGVTLGIIPGALVGEAQDLIVKGDITFVGQVPEPATGALLSLGLLGLALRRASPARSAACAARR